MIQNPAEGSNAKKLAEPEESPGAPGRITPRPAAPASRGGLAHCLSEQVSAKTMAGTAGQTQRFIDGYDLFYMRKTLRVTQRVITHHVLDLLQRGTAAAFRDFPQVFPASLLVSSHFRRFRQNLPQHLREEQTVRHFFSPFYVYMTCFIVPAMVESRKKSS